MSKPIDKEAYSSFETYGFVDGVSSSRGKQGSIRQSHRKRHSEPIDKETHNSSETYGFADGVLSSRVTGNDSPVQLSFDQMLGLDSCVGSSMFVQNNSLDPNVLLASQQHNPLFPPQDATNSVSGLSFHETTDFSQPVLGHDQHQSMESPKQLDAELKSLMNEPDVVSPISGNRPNSADLLVARANCSILDNLSIHHAHGHSDRSDATSASRQSSPGLAIHRQDSVEALLFPLFACGRIAPEIRCLIHRYVPSESVLYCLELAGFTTAPVLACLADDAEIRELEAFIQHAGQFISNQTIRLALLGPVYAMHPSKFRLPLGAICGLRLALKELSSSSQLSLSYSSHSLAVRHQQQSSMDTVEFGRLLGFGNHRDDSNRRRLGGHSNGSGLTTSTGIMMPADQLPPPLGSDRLAAAAAALLPGMADSMIRDQVAAVAAAAARSLGPPATPSSSSSASSPPPMSMSLTGNNGRANSDNMNASRLQHLIEAAAGATGNPEGDHFSSQANTSQSSSLPLLPFLSSGQANGVQAFSSPDFARERLDDFGRFNLERLKQHSIVRVIRIAARHFANAPHLVQGRDFDVEMEVSFTSEGFQRVTGLFYCQLCRVKRDRTTAVRFSVARNRTPVMSNVISHLKIHFQYLGQQSPAGGLHLVSPQPSVSQQCLMPMSPTNFTSTPMSTKMEVYSDPNLRAVFPINSTATSAQYPSSAFSHSNSTLTE